LPRSKQDTIPTNTETENSFFQQKDSSSEPLRLDLSAWAGELKRKIATSQEKTAALRTQAATLRTRADVLSDMAQKADAEAEALRGLLQKVETTEVSIKSGPSAATPRASDGKTLSSRVRAHVKVILKAAGRPLGRTEILAQLNEDGLIVPGRNPAQRVGKMLWEAAEFEYKGKGYWLVGEPIPEHLIPSKRYRAPNKKNS
jgi:predicted ribosome quality control (RQC) complex YloA/Tae2 family protein